MCWAIRLGLITAVALLGSACRRAPERTRTEPKGEVSDPTLRILVLGPSGNVTDTFISRAYGANIPTKEPYWLRVDAVLGTAPDQIKEVRAEVVHADCESGWD